MKKLVTLIYLLSLVVMPRDLQAEGAPAESIADALRQSSGRYFWLERVAGKFQKGDAQSDFDTSRDADQITFDTGNNKVLANVSPNGTLKALTIYRASYRGCSNPQGWSGVWMAKDASSFGPYSYTLEIGGQTNDLDQVDWNYRTSLLDNIFPVTELRDPQKRFVVKLLTFAPISADGEQRLRGVIYGLFLENISGVDLKGNVRLPKTFGSKPPKSNWVNFDPYDFELGLGDAAQFSDKVAFDLKPGGSVWIPTILYQPGETTVGEVNARGTLAWLQDTWKYHRALLGRLATPGNPWLAEFYERQVLQAFQAVAMDGSGKLAGSNWGSYPATRQIWTKDFFYSCLPFMALEPALARKMILWFDEFGVRQKGEVVEGGISHSISLSVASVLLAGLYYDQTGDKTFFAQHPELKNSWRTLLDELAATRQDKDVWLFPTRFISDGKLDCDWHCGSNIAVWRAMSGYARLLKEVYGDDTQAGEASKRAEKIRAAILAKTVVTGPFGPQFIEGVNRDEKVPQMKIDGEESDTTLMPVYGFLPSDDARYENYMRFSVSTNNAQYVAATHSINWEKVPATAPGYNKGLCAGVSADSLFGKQGYFTEIRRVTDVDGSVWWWPRRFNQQNEVEIRRSPGKSGWFAGVFDAVFVNRFLGLAYDAPTHTLRFAPLPATGDIIWSNFPIGLDRFTASYEHGRASITNLNSHSVTVVFGRTPPVTVPAGKSASVKIL